MTSGPHDVSHLTFQKDGITLEIVRQAFPPRLLVRQPSGAIREFAASSDDHLTQLQILFERRLTNQGWSLERATSERLHDPL